MEINELDVVELMDGREVTVLLVFDDPQGYLIEKVDPDTGKTIGDPFTVEPHEIKRVIWRVGDPVT